LCFVQFSKNLAHFMNYTSLNSHCQPFYYLSDVYKCITFKSNRQYFFIKK